MESDILYLQRSNANREKKFEHDSLVVETLDSLMVAFLSIRVAD